MKMGLMLATHEWDDQTLAGTLDYAVNAERLGFDSVYVPNTIGFDALTVMTLIAGATTKININSAVVPIQTRHPFAMAQQIKTMAAATPGRINLAVGLSHKMFIEPFLGLSYDKPAQQMEEYLNILMPLLSDSAAQAKGDFYSGTPMLNIAEAGNVAVQVAAMGPRMLAIAGRLTDGTSLWMTGPSTIREYVVPAISDAAAKAGRKSPDIVAGIPIAVSEDGAKIKAILDEKLAMYGMLPSYRGMLDREGLASPSDIAIVGSESEVIEKVQQYKQAGVTHFNANIIRADDDTTQRTLNCLAGI